MWPLMTADVIFKNKKTSNEMIEKEKYQMIDA